MNAYFRNGMAVIALVASAGVAAAAGMSSSSAAKDHLNLTSAQQKEIWQGMQQTSKATAPASFKPTLGEATPNSIKLQPVPTKVANEVPAVKSYDFAMLQNQVLIVDPSSRKIVDIVSGS